MASREPVQDSSSNQEVVDQGIDGDKAGTNVEPTRPGCPKQADIMSRTMRHKFKWSGVRLLWNGDAGDQPIVAVDHVDQVKEWMAREASKTQGCQGEVKKEGDQDQEACGSEIYGSNC